MSEATDALALPALLGRISYFHALFIEPALGPSTPEPSPLVCCAHGPRPNPLARPAGELLPGSAWEVLCEIAATLAIPNQGCLPSRSLCCATCRLWVSAAMITASWVRTEHRAYRGREAANALVQVCANVAAVRIGCAFAAQHSTVCSRVERPVLEALPSTDELPLSGELLDLWVNPTTVDHHPVLTWLNHCTSLGDVQRVLASKGTPS